jgi:hypothetical protein
MGERPHNESKGNRLWYCELDQTELNWSARQAVHTIWKLIYKLINLKPSIQALNDSEDIPILHQERMLLFVFLRKTN